MPPNLAPHKVSGEPDRKFSIWEKRKSSKDRPWRVKTGGRAPNVEKVLSRRLRVFFEARMSPRGILAISEFRKCFWLKPKFRLWWRVFDQINDLFMTLIDQKHLNSLKARNEDLLFCVIETRGSCFEKQHHKWKRWFIRQRSSGWFVPARRGRLGCDPDSI